jgi:cytidine deaminase
MLRKIRRLPENRTRETRLFLNAIRNTIGDARDLEITEFGRVVHAEMEAIISCARKGLSVKGSTLYCTTFPCHVCAKHIVDAGISEVVFIEPYPKSKATDLHPDSIIVAHESGQSRGKRVLFRPFLGISPRRYGDLFSMRSNLGFSFKRKDSKGNKLPWVNIGQPRTPLSRTTYFDREETHLDDLLQRM